MKTGKKLLSLLLVLIMVFGILPTGLIAPAGAAEVTEAAKAAAPTRAEAAPIRIDFEGFAKDAAKQDWWDDLKVSNTAGVKLIGSKINSDIMTDEQKSAYDAMQAYLQENDVWWIKEEETQLANNNYCKRLYLDASGSDATGVRFYAYLFASQVSDNRAKLVLTINAEAEGLYNMQLDLLKEAGGYSTLPRIDNIGQGGGYGNIYLNGEKLYGDYDFGEREKSGAKNVRETDSFGAVYLNEGENELVIEMTKDYTGNLNNGRRMINLKGLYFTPLADCVVPVGGGMMLDIHDYLPFDVQVSASTHEISCEDETIAKVSMNESLRVVVEGIREGETKILLTKDGETVWSLDAAVVAGQTTAAQPIVIDLKGFAKRASTQSWWNDLTTVYTASGRELKKVGSNRYEEMTAKEQAAYEAMIAWQEENQGWVLNGDGTKMEDALGNRLYLSATDDVAWAVCHNGRYGTNDGASDISVDVDVEHSGWYALNMELVLQHESGKDTPVDTTANVGGGYADIYVNGECVYKGFKFRSTAKSDVVDANFGKVFLNEGSNTLTVRAVGHYNAPVYDGYSGRSNINVASMKLLPLGGTSVEVGEIARLSLGSYFLSYGTEYGTITAKADGMVNAEIIGSDLVLTGVEEGSETVCIYNDGELLAALPVAVTAAETAVYNFTKAASVTADGFENIETYDDLNVDDVRSANWKYEVSNGKNYYDADANAAALLGDGSYVSFMIETTEGEFLPELRYVANPSGGKVKVYMDDAYLGTVDTYAPNAKAETAILRPVQLTEGEYTLTLKLDGKHINNTGSALLYWTDLVLREGTARLTLDAGALSAKIGRPMETILSGGWDGLRYDDLVGAELTAEVSHEDILDVTLIPATDAAPATLQVFASKPVDGASVTVTAEIGGITASREVEVSVLASSAVISGDVSLEGTVTGQIPRLTTRDFVFDLLCEDGDKALPSEVDISYEVSDPAILSVDEEAHTLTTLADGEASVTVTVQQGEFSYTETLALVVGAEGENRLPAATSSFDDAGVWTGMVAPADNKWIMSEITDDGTGNQALKLTVNPKISRNQGNGIAILSKNGTLAELSRGQLYEMSFRFKVEGYKRAETATADPRLILQFYDFATNANSASHINEYYANYVLNYPELEDGVWYDLTIPVRAPISGDGIFYGLTRLTFAPHYAYPGDMDAVGFEGSFWFDDIEIREVGFETVDVTLANDLSSAVGPVALYARPMTTTGWQIKLDAGSVKGNVSVRSSNEDVVRVSGTVKPLSESKATTEGAYEYATTNVLKVGKNDSAQLIASVTIGNETREGALDVSVSGQPNVLRDVFMKLNGCDSLVLGRGQTAQSSITGLTTQLDEIPQSAFEGAYFTSSDISVATVDASTGEVTCVGEGTAIITGYAMWEGTAVKDTAVLTVTDDTDLVSIEVKAPAAFVGTGSTLHLYTEGKKASGGVADMKLYPVAWSIDEESIQNGIASISEDGKLLGLKEGTVTVTATIGVEDAVLTNSMQIAVFPAEEYPGGIIDFDFTDGGILKMETATLAKDNIEIDREKTYGGGEDIEIDQSGFRLDVPVGGKLVLNFTVRKAGWYRAEVRGRSLYYWGCLTGCYVDDMYIGSADFGSDTTSTFAAGGYMNTIYLEAGTHTITLEAEEARKIMLGRVTFFPTTDPNEVDIAMTAEKATMVPGESTTLDLSLWGSNNYEYFLHYAAQKPAYTNYYTLTSSDPSVVKITRDLFTTTLTAVNPGKATITLTGELLGSSVSKQIEVTVKDGTIYSAELSAQRTTVAPDAEPFALTVSVSDKNGVVALPESAEVSYLCEDTDIASVSADGIVTITGKEGSALITATVTEGDHSVQAQIWITVTKGKTAPSLYTYEERAIAQENVLKYDWAWQMKENVTQIADYYVENLDHIYNMWPHEGLPRNTRTAMSYDTEYMICQYCETDLIAAGYGGHYHWLVNPIENPWKVTCPHCKNVFPSNDFESYYKSGLDERGVFRPELADPQYLVNELYPEMGEGWGVDDGWGYHTGELCANGKERILTFIAYYVDCTMYTVTAKNGVHSMPVIFNTLRDAYLYTGDEKYGSAGAILVDRMADLYPGYDLTIHRKGDYALGDGSSKKGKVAGSIWECVVIQAIAAAADAFWPAMDNPDVIEFLQGYAHLKGMAPEDITPAYLRRNAEEGILLEAKDAIERNQANGNFGMEQAAMAIAAVALDCQPETGEMIDWVFAASMEGGMYDQAWNTGGDVYRVLAELVDRDGFGNEGSTSYNMLWLTNLRDLASALNGYDKVESANLWEHPKFLNLYRAYIDLTVCGRLSPQIHETSGAFQFIPSYVSVDAIMPAFLASGDVKIAQSLYFANGNSVNGLHGDIFTKDPEQGVRGKIQTIVDTYGEWDMSESAMLSGFGMAILREGPSRYIKGVNDHEFFDYWINFSLTNSHTHHEALGFDIDAFGIPLSGNMGYPVVMSGSSPERNQWNGNTVSNNTVVVDDSCQYSNPNAGFPLHFADGGKAKVMDVSSPDSYDITDIYRRTVVTVEAENGVHYAVDFFRILGGSEHVYSYHGATRIQPTTENLNLVQQPFGTYAGADVPFGDWDISGTNHGAINTGSGYSWLWDVYRDDTPETNFTVDWKIEDYQHQLATSSGIHLSLTMLSEEPMTEVALANGQPAQDGRAPEHLEFVLVRNSGEPGLDTLFTAVLQPYQGEAYIESSSLVEAKLVDGTENATDRVQAVKVVQTSGRVDYIVYATNPNCTYEIDGKFTFKGFAGVCSYKEDVLIYAWGNEVTAVEDAKLGAVIDNALPAVTGTVVDFTKTYADHYTITVKMDRAVSEDTLTGNYIYVNNDGIKNSVYRIYGAKISGDTAVLDLRTQDLIRGYIDNFDMDRGFLYNIAEGQTYSIPLSATFDVGELFTYTTDTVVKAGNKLNLTTGVAGDRVSYEAEGLVTGMKLDSKTGTLTWTTSKTNVGRYPITIKAVRDGDVIGTMSFTVYVVSYTGSTYAPDKCAHSKAQTYKLAEADGSVTVETVCPACGTITKENVTEEEANKFALAGSSMTLGNELVINFLMKAEYVKDGYYAVVTHNGEETKLELGMYNDTYAAASYKLAAKELADDLTVVICNASGNAVSEVYTTSAKAYAMRILSTGSAKLKTLVVDMLNYGAEAQTYFGYNTASLANADLTAAQRAYATKEVSCTNKQVKGENFYGSNLALEDRIVLNLFFKNMADGYTAKIVFTDFRGETKTVTKELVPYSGKLYKVVVDDIVLADSFCPVTVTVYDADGNACGSATDSVESYVARTGSSALNEAIMKFASSAKAYLS